jgi:hypothetical protein
MKSDPSAVVTVPAMMNPTRRVSAKASNTMPVTSSTPPRAAKRWGAWGRGDRPDSALTAEILPAARAGHQAVATAVRRLRIKATANRPPAQREPIDAMFGDRLQDSDEEEPGDQAEGRAHHGRAGPDRGAVGQHDEPCVPVGGAKGATHAERPQPALGHHRESGHTHQADEQQPEAAQHQHHGLGYGLVGPAPAC